MLFVGRPEERKGLPVLLQAFEGLVEHVPAKLTVVGAGYDDVARYLAEAAAEPHIERSVGSSATSSGAASTRPTCSAPRRSPARASG